jgi:threonine/homoserine/homoserine lactone efflux protein
MTDFSLLAAYLTGAIAGVLVSIPVGPINAAIIHEGGTKGFRWSLFMGAGAVLMEATYCALSFAGFTELFTTKITKAAFQLTSFSLLAYLGIKYMLAAELKTETRAGRKLDEKFHPHTAFWTGFIQVLGNPGVLLMWIALATTFTTNHWVADTYTSKGTCVLGMATGGMIWFTFLSYLISVSHRHISDRGMLWISRVAGAGLLATAIVIGFKLAVLIVKGS